MYLGLAENLSRINCAVVLNKYKKILTPNLRKSCLGTKTAHNTIDIIHDLSKILDFPKNC